MCTEMSSLFGRAIAPGVFHFSFTGMSMNIAQTGGERCCVEREGEGEKRRILHMVIGEESLHFFADRISDCSDDHLGYTHPLEP